LLLGARELGIDLAAGQLRQLQNYADLVRRWNEKFNLVSRQDIGRFVPRHLLDSLTIATMLRPPNMLDLGTGAGLPGIPLAVARPELEVVLLDRGARKTRFLRQVVRQIGLANVTVCCQDVRDATDIGPFASIVSRGVASAAKLWTLAEPLLADCGLVYMMYRTASDEHSQAPAVAGAAVACSRISVPGLPGLHEIVKMSRVSS